MPVYKRRRWLRECLESILSQDFTDFELIVADDGSTDESRAIVRSSPMRASALIELPHDYIGTLNRMLAEARAPLHQPHGCRRPDDARVAALPVRVHGGPPLKVDVSVADCVTKPDKSIKLKLFKR